MGIKDEELKKRKQNQAKARRNKKKYVYLSKNENLRLRQDYMDVDYINGVRDANGKMVIRPLTDEEKTFLNNFYKEDLNASINENNPKFYKEKEQQLDSYNRNNQRNRCLYNREKAQGALVDLDRDPENTFLSKHIKENTISPEEICSRAETENHEELLINKYQKKKKRKKKLK